MINTALLRRAINWSVIEIIVRQGLSFFVLVILARILSPHDFGLIALLVVFNAIGEMLVDSGFGQALIQRKNTTIIDESTIFFFSLLSGFVVALLLSLLAPFIAHIYGQPVIENLTYWMAVNLFIHSAGAIHIALLSKELDYRAIAKASMIAGPLSGVVAIVMAYHGYGVWSLLFQRLLFTTVNVALLWLFHSWRPHMAFSVHSLRSLLSFGGYLLWSGILATLHRHLYALLIGKMHSIQDVGYYSQADRIQKLPIGVMTNVLKRIAFPVFSMSSDDKSKLSRGLLKAIALAVFINTPVMAWLFVMSESLIVVLFGDKWISASEVLRALSIVGILWPLHALNISALLAQGYSRLDAKVQLFRLSIAILLLIIASPFGIVAIAYAQVIASIIALFVNTHYSRIYLDCGGITQLIYVTPYFFASFMMAIGVYMVSEVFHINDLLGVFISMLVGAICYLIICMIMRLNALTDIYAIISNK